MTTIKWNDNDLTLLLYFYKYGTKRLLITDLEMSEKLGTSLDILKKESLNIGYIIHEKIKGTKSAKKIIEKFLKIDESELRNIVLDIINDSNRNTLIEERKRSVDILLKEQKEKEEAKKLQKIFKKLGKDPSKMKLINKRAL
jgi:hypothetical protein